MVTIIIGAWAYALVDAHPSWEPVPAGRLPAVCVESAEACIPADWSRDEIVRWFVGCDYAE